MKKRSSELGSVSKKPSQIQRKDSNVKQNEFDQLLKSGETILLSLSSDKSVEKQDDGLEKIVSLVNQSQDYIDQRAAGPKKALPHIGEEGGASSILSSENKRLESRIQKLNSELFKERAANAELSDQVKVLLNQLEEIRRRSIHQIPEEIKETEEAVLQTIQQVNLNETLSATDIKLPSLEVQPSSDPWEQRYQELEQRCNLLSKRAVQTIQETKLQLVILQQDNLELKDRIRELQADLEKREEEKTKAMSLIPRLIEMVRSLQLELEQEKTKRELESEFDALQFQVARQV